MKRLHLHLSVKNLDENIQFYSSLFNAEPIKVKDDYAKWMLDDPYINFAISTRSNKIGLDHLGIQVEEQNGLQDIRKNLSAANISTHHNGETTCCYAKAQKSWVEDPNGIAWEAYHTMDDAEIFGEDAPIHSQCSSTDGNKINSSCC